MFVIQGIQVVEGRHDISNELKKNVIHLLISGDRKQSSGTGTQLGQYNIIGAHGKLLHFKRPLSSQTSELLPALQ
jgi:hypothetical protein